MARLDVEVEGATLAAEVHEIGDHWSPAVDRHSQRLPLLLLNPAVGDRRIWHRVVPTWSTTRRVVTFDQRGAGESQWEPTARHDSVADAVAVLDAAGVERAVVVGNSFGGAKALHLALEHPDRVAGLLLVAPAVTGAPLPDFDDPVACPPEAIELDEACDAAAAGGHVEEAIRLQAALWLDGWASLRPRVDPVARGLFEEMNRRITTSPATGHAPQREPAWPRLEEVTVPTLVVTGGRDLPYMNDRAREAADRMPAATHVELPDAAHLPQLDGHLRFLAATQEFLDDVAP